MKLDLETGASLRTRIGIHFPDQIVTSGFAKETVIPAAPERPLTSPSGTWAVDLFAVLYKLIVELATPRWNDRSRRRVRNSANLGRRYVLTPVDILRCPSRPSRSIRSWRKTAPLIPLRAGISWSSDRRGLAAAASL